MSRLFYQVMQDNVGNLLFGVTGTMRLAGTATLATIYGDEALTVILPNPMTNHPSYGSFKCYLDAGVYDFYMAKPGYSFETLSGLQGGGTMSQQDADSVAITGGTATLTTMGIGTTPQAGNVLSVTGRTVFDGDVGVRGVPIYPFQVYGQSALGSAGIGAPPDPANALSVTGRTVFDGDVGVHGAPLYPLQVYGQAALGSTGIGAPPDAGNALSVTGRTVLDGDLGVHTVPLYPLDVTGHVRLGNVGINAPPIADAALAVVGNALVSGGVVGVHTAPDPAAVLKLVHEKNLGVHGIWVGGSGSDTGGSTMLFTNMVGTVVGSITATAASTGYNTTSDARLKHSIEALVGALDVVRALNPVSFVWKVDGSPGRGLLAHELQLVVPEAVIGQPDAVNADGSIQPQQVDYSKLVPYLISAVQELAQQRESAMPAPSALAGLGGRVAVLFRNRTGAIAGSIQADETGTAYNTISDHRLNHADIELEDGLDLLKQLRPVRFLWSFNDEEGVGFLGHQVAEVISGVITGERDAVDDDGQLLPQQIDYGKLVPYLVSAVQTLARQVETLTARLATLEAAPGA